MSDETTRSGDPEERAEQLREHQEKAQEHNPDERPPEARAGDEDPSEAGLLGGISGSAVTTEHEEPEHSDKPRTSGG
jgi:hypothetical protein